MAETDYIDHLNNKELRGKCVQYGLPNVPVTDSTRKYLIRRLRAAMDEVATATKPNSKHTNATRSNKEARKTMAPQMAATPVMERELRKRHTLAGNANSTAAARTRIIPIAIEDHCEDIGGGYTDAYSSMREVPRTRRSVSLTKTGVLTTSFNQDEAPMRRCAQKQWSADAEDDGYEYLSEQIPIALNSSRNSSYNGSNASDTSSIVNIPRYRRSVSLSKSGVMTTSYRQETVPLRRRIVVEEELDEDTVVDEHSEEEEEEDEQQFTDRQHNYKAATQPRATYVKTPMLNSTMRYGVDSAKQSYNNRRVYDIPSGADISDADADDTETESDVSDLETPYFSEFTRRLEELKSQPLQQDDVVIVPPKQIPVKRMQYAKMEQAAASPPRYDKAAALRVKPKPRPPIGDDNDSLELQFRRFIAALEHKYQLKQWLAMLIFLALVAFVYTFFVQ